MPTETLKWSPQLGPQTQFLERDEFEAGYGGAKGGGKTDALLFGALRQVDNPDYRAIIFRRTYPMLKELIDRSQVFKKLKGIPTYTGDKHRWTFPSGAIIDFGHCQTEEDKQNYQGQEYHWMGFDQLEQFTETQYTFLIANIRAAKPGIKLRVRSTFNPGGVGHAWVKKRFIDGKEPGKKYVTEYDIKNPVTGQIQRVSYDSVFIPAKVWDNKILLDNNPNYLANLMQLDEKTRKALLEGNWDIFAGQYFTEWNRDQHVIIPMPIPEGWRKFRMFDYGFAKPAACMWGALNYDGQVVIYKEFYKSGWDVEQLANEIIRLSGDEQYMWSVADPSIFARTGQIGLLDKRGGSTIGETFARHGVQFKPASNNRLAGWNRMHQYLRWDEWNKPKLFFFNTCTNAIRTIPALIHDESNSEDLDTNSDDHVADAVRYGLMELHEARVEAPMNEVQRKLAMMKAEREWAANPLSHPYD